MLNLQRKGRLQLQPSTAGGTQSGGKDTCYCFPLALPVEGATIVILKANKFSFSVSQTMKIAYFTLSLYSLGCVFYVIHEQAAKQGGAHQQVPD